MLIKLPPLNIQMGNLLETQEKEVHVILKHIHLHLTVMEHTECIGHITKERISIRNA